MDVSIILVNYNCGTDLPNCINSLSSHTKGISYEIIIVDNASTDNSLELVNAGHNTVKIFKNNDNKGFGAANNLGVQHASGKYVFLLNVDTLLLDNAILHFFSFMEQHPRIALCCGNLINTALQPIHSFLRYTQSPFSDFMEYSKIGNITKKYNRSSQYNDTSEILNIPFSTGADMFMRKETFLKYKGFDEAIFLYYEDADLCYRMHKSGEIISNLPYVKIIHNVGLRNASLGRVQKLVKGKHYFYKKAYGSIGLFMSKVVDISCMFLGYITYGLLRNKNKKHLCKYYLQSLTGI